MVICVLEVSSRGRVLLTKPKKERVRPQSLVSNHMIITVSRVNLNLSNTNIVHNQFLTLKGSKEVMHN